LTGSAKKIIKNNTYYIIFIIRNSDNAF